MDYLYKNKIWNDKLKWVAFDSCRLNLDQITSETSQALMLFHDFTCANVLLQLIYCDNEGRQSGVWLRECTASVRVLTTNVRQ